MSDIRAGDVVVCVDAAPERQGQNTRLVEGRLYRVLEIGLTPHTQRPAIDVGLKEFTYPPRNAVHVTRRFRKLNDEPEQTEIVERIKRCVPSRPLETISSAPKLRTVGEGG